MILVMIACRSSRVIVTLLLKNKLSFRCTSDCLQKLKNEMLEQEEKVIKLGPAFDWPSSGTGIHSELFRNGLCEEKRMYCFQNSITNVALQIDIENTVILFVLKTKILEDLTKKDYHIDDNLFCILENNIVKEWREANFSR